MLIDLQPITLPPPPTSLTYGVGVSIDLERGTFTLFEHLPHSDGRRRTESSSPVGSCPGGSTSQRGWSAQGGGSLPNATPEECCCGGDQLTARTRGRCRGNSTTHNAPTSTYWGRGWWWLWWWVITFQWLIGLVRHFFFAPLFWWWWLGMIFHFTVFSSLHCDTIFSSPGWVSLLTVQYKGPEQIFAGFFLFLLSLHHAELVAILRCTIFTYYGRKLWIVFVEYFFFGKCHWIAHSKIKRFKKIIINPKYFSAVLNIKFIPFEACFFGFIHMNIKNKEIIPPKFVLIHIIL